MSERIYLQLFHSDVPGAVPEGLKIGELGLNVADGIEFYGYGGDVNYDINGDPLPDLPPPGMGWKATGIGGDGPPGPPGPAGPGVPEGGTTGQYLRKATNGDYVTVWDDGPVAATPTGAGLVFGVTNSNTFGLNANIGYNVAVDDDNLRTAAIGYDAGGMMHGTQDNVLAGYRAGYNIDGNRNVILGSEAAGNLPGGGATNNVFIGYQTGYNITSANGNTFVGPYSGMNVRTGDNNTIVGGYDGTFDLQSNVVLSDGTGNVRFQSNTAGAWSPDGVDYGQSGYILTSNGANDAPEWKPAPGAGVTQIVAGNGMVVSPESGTGVVTVSFNGDPDAGVDSLTSGEGITFRNAQGAVVPTITSTGSISVNPNQVLTPSLYTEAGSILIGGLGSGGVVALAPGNLNQVLTIGPDGLPYWANSAATGNATPTKAGVVFGRTDGGPTGNVSLGLNSGGAITGAASFNTLIGTGAGYEIITGDNNTVVGNFAGQSDLQGNVVLADGAGNVRFQTNADGALSFDGTDFGTAGYVLSSNGPGQPPQWIDPPNAPIQTITEGTGINVTQIGTAVEISNAGVTNLVGTAPIQVSDNTGDITISAPNVLTDLTNGAGITITGSGNSRTVTNTGVVQLVDGTNTTVVNVSPGVFKINAAGGGGGGNITELIEGAGINITSPTGPTPTITNTGVLSVAPSATVVPSASTGAGITFSVQNVVATATAGPGISITGTSSNPTINNTGVIQLVNGTGTTVVNNGNGSWQVNATGTAGVTKIIAGTNVSISPTSGIGEVTISASGGGGGGSITTINGGPGISIDSPTGPTVTINNTGIRTISPSPTIGVQTLSPGVVTLDTIGVVEEVRAGAGIAISGSPEFPTITNIGVRTLTAGTGIQLSGGAGDVTISAIQSGGTVKEVTSTNSFITVTGGTGPTVSLTNNGVCTITAGTGITKSGAATTPTLAIDPATVLLNANLLGGNGISITGTGNTKTVANTGVVSLKNGTGINATQGANGEWTIANTGVTKLTAGSNITLSGNSGEITISAAGGGGGGTITGVTAGYGLTGGGTTGNVTVAVDTTKVVTYDAYKEQGPGGMLYRDTTGTDWTGSLPGTAGPLNKAVLQGWQFGPGTFVEWGFPDVGGFQNSPSVSYRSALIPTVHPNEFLFDVNESWVNASWVRRDAYDAAGTILVADSASNPTALPAGANGQVLTIVSGRPAWATGGGGGSYTVSAPITLTGSTIGFDVATTSLTQYVPKSAFSAAETLLVGSGVGTFTTLAPGANGQVLTVTPGGLAWVTPSGGGSTFSLTSPDESLTITPSPFTGGTGTIVVNTNKFVSTSILTTPGDLIVGAGSPTQASRLPAGGTVGMVLTVTETTGNSRIGWSNSIYGGTY